MQLGGEHEASVSFRSVTVEFGLTDSSNDQSLIVFDAILARDGTAAHVRQPRASTMVAFAE